MSRGGFHRRPLALVATLAIASSVLVVGATVAGAQPGQAPAGAPPPSLLGTDQLIVRTQGNAVPDAAELADDAGGAVDDARVVRRMGDGSWVVRLPDRLPDAAAQALARRWTRRADVVVAEPDRIRTHTRVPNDPSYGSQWHYRTPTATVFGANLPPAWDVTTGSSSVVVAVLDTGRLDHADLAGQWVGGYDFIWDSQVANDGNGRDADPSDPGDWITSAENSSGYFAGCGASASSWHGTHVAGTIAAATNNGVGVAGVAWGAKVLPVRVLGKCGGYDSDIIDGLRWAAGLSVSGVPANPNPAQVLNLSLGGSGACSTAWQSAINAVTTAGATVVVSAGNSNVNASTATPANCSNVITVAASGSTGSRAYYSNYGTSVEITAPGGDAQVGLGGVLSTLNTGTQGPVADSYAWYQGTSMAAPHVAGAAALIKSVRPSATPAQVLAYLQQNVTPFPAGSSCTTSTCGTGLLNVDAAVRAAASVPGAPGAPTATAGDGQATVSWSAPSADGGTPITGYTVTPYIGAVAQAPRAFSSTATSQVVTGLANGTTYTFRVAATNAIGTGAASASSNGVTPAPPFTLPGTPGAPTGVVGDGSVTLSWIAPADGGSPITGYTVTPYADGQALAPRTFASPATTQEITGLANSVRHTFRVVATNAAGTGPASADSAVLWPHAGLPQLRIGDARIPEGGGSVVVPISVTKPVDVLVKLTTKGGTATAGIDYTPFTALPVTFTTDGPLVQEVTVPIIDDATREATETFNVVASASTKTVALADGTGQVSIIDDDGLPPQIYVEDVPAVDEGQTATFRIAVRGTVAQAVSVPYKTVPGTAAAGSDFTPASGQVAFVAGEVDPVRTVTVPVVDDGLTEGVETFSLRLTPRSGLTFGDPTGTATIAPSDGGTGKMPAVPRLRIFDVRVLEGGVAALEVQVDQSVDASVLVQSKNGRATADVDFTSVVQPLTFTAGGPTSATVLIPIADDTAAELDETFSVTLSKPLGAAISDSTGVVTIVDADGGPPRVRISDATVQEGQTARFLIEVEGEVAAPFTIRLSSMSGTATKGADFGETSVAQITIPAGVTDPVAYVTVATVADGVAEVATGEKFRVKLTLPSGSPAKLSDNVGYATIRD